ncbi:D-cysteine desulfhydrase 2, mitochondrial [Linum perenne]
MNLQCLTNRTATAVAITHRRHKFICQISTNSPGSGEELVSKLLSRKWTLQNPGSEVHRIQLSPSPRLTRSSLPLSAGESGVENYREGPSFYVVRDDLLHPLANGNKARKLDALIPLLLANSVTDVVTCGGCQSAHTAAVAVLCAERGIRSHLLLRGEQPEILTGYNLISTMYGHVSYVARSVYADREAMLKSHADTVVGSSGHVLWCSDISEDHFKDESREDECPRKVMIINEGAGDCAALLAFCRSHPLG